MSRKKIYDWMGRQTLRGNTEIRTTWVCYACGCEHHLSARERSVPLKCPRHSAEITGRKEQVVNPILLNRQETETVLAALRFWQRNIEKAGTARIMEFFFEEVEPLTAKEIDVLAEKLNFGE